MNPVTSGPKVNESLETNIPGVFACGNVLHVHDLVDFVSEEAKTAGKNAAAYVKADGVEAARDNDIVLNPIEGVRYTVPGTINAASMDEQITVLRDGAGEQIQRLGIDISVWAVYTRTATSALILMMRESSTENVRLWHREKWKRSN
jgi:hypothetical protein